MARPRPITNTRDRTSRALPQTAAEDAWYGSGNQLAWRASCVHGDRAGCGAPRAPLMARCPNERGSRVASSTPRVEEAAFAVVGNGRSACVPDPRRISPRRTPRRRGWSMDLSRDLRPDLEKTVDALIRSAVEPAPARRCGGSSPMVRIASPRRGALLLARASQCLWGATWSRRQASVRNKSSMTYPRHQSPQGVAPGFSDVTCAAAAPSPVTRRRAAAATAARLRRTSSSFAVGRREPRGGDRRRDVGARRPRMPPASRTIAAGGGARLAT